MREIYQRLYDQNINDYGRPEADRSPATRYAEHFEWYLTLPVLDFGCGRNALVKNIQSQGLTAYGFDWVNIPEVDFVLDITQSIKHLKVLNPKNTGTALCIDVFEHISDTDLQGLICNLQQSQRQVISVFSGSHTIEGNELHINQKTIEEWTSFISQHFKLNVIIQLDTDNRYLYLTETK